MRTLLGGLFLTMLLTGQLMAQVPDPMPIPMPFPDPPPEPGVTITDKSVLDVQVKKINCKASVVPVGGATIQSVRFDVYKGATKVDGGAGTKINATNDWTMGNTIILNAGTYKVITTVMYKVPGSAVIQPATKESGAFVIP